VCYNFAFSDVLKHPIFPAACLSSVHSSCSAAVAAGLAWGSLELISYIIIRPFFLQLLENNPKFAGQTKKKEATATQMMPRVVCFVHNVIQVQGAQDLA
jgi:hypothetical protein